MTMRLVTLGSTPRAGGTPTLAGTPFIQADVERHFVTTPESCTELWYMINPPTAGGSLSIPNTGTKKVFYEWSAWRSGDGMATAFESAAGGTGATANPYVPLTTVHDGDLLVAAIGNGGAGLAPGSGITTIAATGSDGITAATEYANQTSKGAWPAVGTPNWTAGAEDWGLVVAAFYEIGSPEVSVISLLDALWTLARGTNLFSGPVRQQSTSVPHQAVFVLPSGGPAPDAYSDGTVIEMRYSAIQVIVRSNPKDYAGGQVLARQVRDALHHVAVTGYVDIRAMQSEPIYIGPDEADRHLFSVNLEMWRET